MFIEKIASEDVAAQHPDVFVRSRREASTILQNAGGDYRVISIGAPGTMLPKGFSKDDEAHRRFEFDDIRNEPTDKQREYYRAPSKEDVREIIEHGTRSDRPVLAHCRAGVSRGPASAWAIRCARGEDPREALDQVVQDRPQASPNPLMTQYADELLGLDGEMVEALEELPPPRYRGSEKTASEGRKMTVFPNVYTPAYEGGDPEEVPGGEVIGVSSALTDRHPHDEVFAMYRIPGVQQGLRLKKSSIEPLKSRGFTPQMEWLAADIDMPDHRDITPEDIEKVRETRDRVPLLERAGVYTTPRGWRALWPLEEPTSIDEGQEALSALHDRLTDEDIPVDESTADWTRLFRLPRTKRDPDRDSESEVYEPDWMDLSQMGSISIEDI